MGSKLDNLVEFLATTSTKMDIVAITGTSEKEDLGFLNNIEIEGYEFYHTASKKSKVGTAIYVNKMYHTVERSDLNIIDTEFETTWIEIKNKNSKNIICGNIYRHPHNNCLEFHQYLEKCLLLLQKKIKIYVETLILTF